MNWRAIGAIVIGVLAFAAGVYLKLNPVGDVMCGSEAMSPGDLCEKTNRGITRTYTYEGMRESHSQNSFIAMGAGALGILYGGFLLWRGKKKAAAPAGTA